MSDLEDASDGSEHSRPHEDAAQEQRDSSAQAADDSDEDDSSSLSSSSSSSDSNETASVAPLSDSDGEEAPEKRDTEASSGADSSSKRRKGKKRTAPAAAKRRGPKRQSGASRKKFTAFPPDDSNCRRRGKKVLPQDVAPNSSDAVDKFLAARTRDGKHEFLVKHKHTSYHHLTWLPEDILLEMSAHNKGRIQRWLEQNGEPDARDDDYFNPSYRLLERVVAVRQKGNEYLVKWRDLNYNDCTWEKVDMLQELEGWKEKLEDFRKRSDRPQSTKTPDKVRVAKDMDLPKFPEGRTLRPYQVEGFRWLAYSWVKRNRGILADEMGLGKTIQAISVLHWLNMVGVPGPFIVVAPLSTLGQWQRELEAWSDLNVVIYHGDAKTREVIHQYEWNFPSSPRVKFHVLVTSYEMLLTEQARLSKVAWKYMILDEGHRIKNTQAKVLVALEKFTAEHKLILTGTPLQNNMSELWSMLNFLEPEKFNDQPAFLESYGNLQDAAQLAKLQQMLAPHFLRRLKEDVEKDLPIKEEIIIMVDMNSIQKAFYKAVLERNGEFLRRGSGVRAKLLNIFMELRKVCNHPYLLIGAEAQLTEGKSKAATSELLVTASSKMIFLDKLLRKLKEENHKVLIFSQMTRQLDILEDYLATREFAYERLDGSHSQAQREQSLRKFRKGDTFVFLLSTRAGEAVQRIANMIVLGVGLNLTTADTVVIFDSDWNPQNDLQAQARCHRIGQTVPVTIYRLLTQDSYEKHMFETASKKLGLATAVLGKREAAEVVEGGDPQKELDAKELHQLLRFGAYQLFNTDATAEQATDKRIMDESLDSILARASRIQYIDAGTGADGPKVSFAKAAFDEVAAEVKLDDEAFWDKILPEFKSTRRFMAKLESAAEMKDDEKAALLEAIPELVAEVKKNASNRNFWASFDPMQDLVTMLTKLANSSAFTPEQREAARAHLEELLSSGRRHGRLAPSKMYAAELAAANAAAAAMTPVPATSSTEPVEIPDDSPPEINSSADLPFQAPDSDKEKKKRKRAPNGCGLEKAREREERKAEKLKTWTKQRRNAFRQTLLVYGWGRWDKLNEQASLKRSPSTVQSFAESWICTPGFESELNAVLRDTKRDVLESAIAMDAPEGPIDAEIELSARPDQPLLPDDTFVLKVVSPSSTTPCALEKPLAAVIFFLADNKGDSLPVRLVQIPALNQAITVNAPGFTGQYVARLVAGRKTYSYSDNDAPFAVQRPPYMTDEPGPKHGQIHRLRTMRLINRMASIYGVDFKGLPNETNDYYTILECLDDTNTHTVMPRGFGPALWWCEEFDRRLLSAVYHKGLRLWDFHQDPSSGLDDQSIELYFTSRGLAPPLYDAAVQPLNADGSKPTLRLLPMSNKLGVRLERLLAGLEYLHTPTRRRDPAPTGVVQPAAQAVPAMQQQAPAAAQPPTAMYSTPVSAAGGSAAPVKLEMAADEGVWDDPEKHEAKKPKPSPPVQSLAAQLAQKALGGRSEGSSGTSSPTKADTKLAVRPPIGPVPMKPKATSAQQAASAAAGVATAMRLAAETVKQRPTEDIKAGAGWPAPQPQSPPRPTILAHSQPSPPKKLPNSPPSVAPPSLPVVPSLTPQNNGVWLNGLVSASPAPKPATVATTPAVAAPLRVAAPALSGGNAPSFSSVSSVVVVDLSSDEESPPKRLAVPSLNPTNGTGGTSTIKLHLPADSE